MTVPPLSLNDGSDRNIIPNLMLFDKPVSSELDSTSNAEQFPKLFANDNTSEYGSSTNANPI